VGFKGIFAATASVALMAAPTMAAAQTSAATTKATTEVAPAGENVQGSELRGGFIIPLIALIAIILGILAALDHGNNDLPHSP
jgi:glycerol uptake facilitator-like aquaporin